MSPRPVSKRRTIWPLGIIIVAGIIALLMRLTGEERPDYVRDKAALSVALQKAFEFAAVENGSRWRTGQPYISLTIKTENGAGIPNLVKDVLNQPHQGAVLTLRTVSGKNAPVQILSAWEKSGDVIREIFRPRTFKTDLQTIPKDPLTLVLELRLLEKLPISLAAGTDTLADFNVLQTIEINRLSLDFLSGQSLRLYRGSVSSAANKTLAEISVEGTTSRLPENFQTNWSYSQLMAFRINGTSIDEALGDLNNGFWNVPQEVLRASCGAIAGALKDNLDLASQDIARVLWAMVQSHGLFAETIDYSLDCLGEDLSAQLHEVGLSLPKPHPPSTPESAIDPLNDILSKTLDAMENGGPADTISKLMENNVLIRDHARLLYPQDGMQVLESPDVYTLPAASAGNAADYLISLPLRHFGCFSEGGGQIGRHRASLVELENDPTLWVLNLAITEKGTVNGLAFHPASQSDYCQAIGGRQKTNRCTFSGKSFNGLDPKRCL